MCIQAIGKEDLRMQPEADGYMEWGIPAEMKGHFPYYI